MGILITRLWNYLFALPAFKACIVGLDNGGKTTILFQLHCGELIETQPTIGSNVEEVRSYLGGKNGDNASLGNTKKTVIFHVWDLGGQESLRSTWSTYFENTHAIIFVVDSSDRARLPVVQSCLQSLLRNELLMNAVILIYANKQDLKGSLSAAELAAALRLHAVTTHSWHIQACSALRGEGLSDGFEWLISKVMAQKRLE